MQVVDRNLFRGSDEPGAAGTGEVVRDGSEVIFDCWWIEGGRGS